MGLVEVYKKVIEPKLKDWVVFEHGTCVILYHPPKDLKAEAIEVLKKYGQVQPGTSTADFNVLKVDSGWIVAGDQPGILNYVSEEEGNGHEFRSLYHYWFFSVIPAQAGIQLEISVYC